MITASVSRVLVGVGQSCLKWYAEGRNRTGTGLPPRDFKSLASTNSATPATFIFNGLHGFTWQQTTLVHNFLHNSMCIFTFFLMPYWVNYANLENLLDKQNIKNIGGIMSYQLLIFHLILVVFLIGCGRGLSSYCDSEKKTT